MIKPIITDKKELAKTSAPVVAGRSQAATNMITDLLDTAEHYRKKPIGCVGLAANQIGYLARIIVVWNGGEFQVMINPEIEARTDRKAVDREGCLSRPGVNRKISRYKRIKVTFYEGTGIKMTQKLSNFQARVVQHEVDHLDGITI